jgi:hypothetical protein
MAVDDLDALTTREMTAGMMRGNREKMQLGYSAGNAALAAASYKDKTLFGGDFDPNDPVLRDDLIPYAEGFEDGMAEILERSVARSEWLAQDESYVRHTDDPDYIRTEAYEDGLRDGQQEHAMSLYPALKTRPRPDYIQRFPERLA